MKTNRLIIQWLTVLTFSIISLPLSTVLAQGTAFTYQGRLNNNGSPASGTYNLTFSLFNTHTSGVPIAGPVTNTAVSVTNGLFTVLIDFGPGAFTGQTNWLEIAVETNGVTTFTTLTPRQQLTPTPYAIDAESAGGLSGTFSASQLTSLGNTNGGTGNFFVGQSGSATTSGIYNTANGDYALSANTSGNFNTANGGYTLAFNTNGYDNTANGYQALFNNTSGYNNTANGVQALFNNTSGAYNTAHGFSALYSNTGGNYNTANGGYALYNNLSGSFNMADGFNALYYNLSGNFNLANGGYALFSNTSGSGNTAIGIQALNSSTSGSNNIAVGYQAGYNLTGSSNIDIGNEGFSTDTNIIRIGSGQSQTFIAGVINGNGRGLTGIPGAIIWQTASGTVQAQPDQGYIATDASPVSITLPASLNVGDTVRVSGPALGGWKIAQNSGQSVLGGGVLVSLPYIWLPRGPVANWQAVASSSDGSNLVACVDNGQIYTSTDSGVTWTPRDSSRRWSGVASSSGGSNLVACVNGGQIYASTDSGATWTPHGPITNWTCVASSSDGSKLVAGVGTVSGLGNAGQIYTSTDSGATWTPHGPITNWTCVASSANGSQLVAGIHNAGQIYVSSDSGLTWTTQGGYSHYWWSVASSADGKSLVAGDYGGQIYTSTDWGMTWTGRFTNDEWLGVASSSDGSKLVACVDGGQIYTSTDSGVTWTARESNRSWWSVASSADGSKLVACVHGGQIYTSALGLLAPGSATTTGTAGYLTGAQGAAIELQYVGNNLFLPISHEGTIFAY